MPLHHVKELLGHANIATTDTYLDAGRVHLRESMLRIEAGQSATNLPHATVPTAGDLGREQAEDTAGKSLVH